MGDRLVRLIFLTWCFLIAEPVLSETSLVIILDSSGSMAELTPDGNTRLESATKALEAIISKLPRTSLVGVRVYGRKFGLDEKASSCKDTELLIPLAPVDINAIAETLAGIKPGGYTPTALALLQARDDFIGHENSKKAVILLSDGEETCGGNPVDVLKQLALEGFAVTVHTIGFGAHKKARQELALIAKSAGGQYFNAVNTAELQSALTGAISTLKSERGDLGGFSDAGETRDLALKIEAGDHAGNFLGQGDIKDTFVFVGRKGEKYSLTLKVQRETTAKIKFQFSDASGNLLMEDTAGSAETSSDVLEIEQDREYLITVLLMGKSDAELPYFFRLERVVGF